MPQAHMWGVEFELQHFFKSGHCVAMHNFVVASYTGISKLVEETPVFSGIPSISVTRAGPPPQHDAKLGYHDYQLW